MAVRAVVKMDGGQLMAYDFIGCYIGASLEGGDPVLERVGPAGLAPHTLRNPSIRGRIKRPDVDSAREIKELHTELRIDHEGYRVRSLTHSKRSLTLPLNLANGLRLSGRRPPPFEQSELAARRSARSVG